MINSLEEEYTLALRFTKSHYENFPVISLFIPKKLRKHVAVVYWFARQADDLADEGNVPADERIINLEKYSESLTKSIEGNFESDFWKVLNNTIKEYRLNPKHFFDLLKAFKQDVIKSRYSTFNEVLNYCGYSANPVGRIILEFFDVRDREIVKYSDSVCTALQLTNFYQDFAVDLKKKRIYIPIDELRKFGFDEENVEIFAYDDNFKELIKFQIDRTRELFFEGRKLVKFLPNRLKTQIKWTILGGEEILRKIEKLNFDVIDFRPTLSKYDYIKLMNKAIFGSI